MGGVDFSARKRSILAGREAALAQLGGLRERIVAKDALGPVNVMGGNE